MTSGELKNVLGGRGGRSAAEAWLRRAVESASNSRKRRETFQAVVEGELASTYMLHGEVGAVGAVGARWGRRGRGRARERGRWLLVGGVRCYFYNVISMRVLHTT
jgi:hypothetical protein